MEFYLEIQILLEFSHIACALYSLFVQFLDVIFKDFSMALQI